MSTGCLSCFKVMCFKKKQNKKEDNPVKTERLPEPVGEKEDVEKKEGIQDKPLRAKAERLPERVKYSACNKMPEKWMFKPKPEWISHVGSSDIGPNVYDLYGDQYAETDVSSTSMNNEFNKVKTFDIRGVKLATAKE